jgi:hypothetical protein
VVQQGVTGLTFEKLHLGRKLYTSILTRHKVDPKVAPDFVKGQITYLTKAAALHLNQAARQTMRGGADFEPSSTVRAT